MTNLTLYIITAILLLCSYIKNAKKTKQALKKGLKSLLNILPDFATVLLIVGLVFTLLSPSLIGKYVGSNSGWSGMIFTSIAGAVTLIPGFVAFPLAKSLMDKGAGVAQMGVFISSLMMVGFVTLPLEIKYFGKKVAILRNGASYLYSIIVGIVLGLIITGL